MTVRIAEDTWDRLVLVKTPAATLSAAGCILVCGLLATGLMAVSAFRMGDRLFVALAGVVAMVVVVASILVAGSAATITVTLDRTTNSVRFDRLGQFGRSVVIEPLSVVEDAVLEEFEIDNDQVYRLVLRLRGGRTLPLEWYCDRDAETKRHAAAVIRDFLSRGNTNDD